MNKKFTTVLLAVWLPMMFAMQWLAAGHPSENYSPNELREDYSKPYSARVARSLGEMTFVESYPEPWSLTDAEKYMLKGTAEGPPEMCKEGGLPSWLDQVMDTVGVYYREFGEIPPQVTPQVYADAYGIDVDSIQPLKLELMRNPLTGDYPRTDAVSFSPGELYIKALSTDEMAHFASFEPFYYECWFNGRTKGSDGEWVDLPISGPVLYVRLYGWNDVIYNELRFGGVAHVEPSGEIELIAN